MKRSVLKIGTVARTYGVLVFILTATTCWAHPGHDADGGDWSLLHYLTEPDHLVGLLALALGAVGLLGLWTMRARSTQDSAEHTIRRPDDRPASARQSR